MKIASLLFIPALLLSGLTARAGLPASAVLFDDEHPAATGRESAIASESARE